MIGEKRGTIFASATDYEYTLANEIKSDYNTHAASTTYHVAADTNLVTSSDSTTLATVITLVNEIKVDFNAHLTESGVHRTSDTFTTIIAADAIDLTSVYALLNELRTKYNAHIARTDNHKAADTSNTVTSTIVADASPDIDFNADGGSVLVEITGASSWNGTVDFQTTPDGSTFYNIPYINRTSLSPVPTVSQISSPSTATLYMLLGPLSQTRIACGAGTTGNLTVVWRTIAGSNLNQPVFPSVKTVRTTKAIAAAGDYAAEDVISESASAGTDWDFPAIFRANNSGGYLVKAQAIWQTTGLTPRLTVYLFNVAPATCATNDNAANTAPHNTDKAGFVAQLDFPALEDLGGVSLAIISPSTLGRLPLWVDAASTADDLFGIVATRDAITGEVATNELSIELSLERY